MFPYQTAMAIGGYPAIPTALHGSKSLQSVNSMFLDWSCLTFVTFDAGWMFWPIAG